MNIMQPGIAFCVRGLGCQVATAPSGVSGQVRPLNVLACFGACYRVQPPSNVQTVSHYCLRSFYGLLMLMRPLHTKHQPSSAKLRHMIVRLPTFWGPATNPSSQPETQAQHRQPDQPNWRRFSVEPIASAPTDQCRSMQFMQYDHVWSD